MFVIIELSKVFADVTEAPAMFMLALAPLAVALPIVLGASIIVGVPVAMLAGTLCLEKRRVRIGNESVRVGWSRTSGTTEVISTLVVRC